MDDLALVNATARLVSAKERIAQIEADIQILRDARRRVEVEIEGLGKFIDTWYELAGIQAPALLEHSAYTRDLQRSRPKNPDREFVAEECVQIIKSFGAPMPRRDLFLHLINRGIAIEGKNPEMVLSTMLWRTKNKVVRFPRHGYWPAGIDYAPAGYFFFGPFNQDVLGVTANEPEDGIEIDE